MPSESYVFIVNESVPVPLVAGALTVAVQTLPPADGAGAQFGDVGEVENEVATVPFTSTVTLVVAGDTYLRVRRTFGTGRGGIFSLTSTLSLASVPDPLAGEESVAGTTRLGPTLPELPLHAASAMTRVAKPMAA